jgi:hypothetical protein
VPPDEPNLGTRTSAIADPVKECEPDAVPVHGTVAAIPMTARSPEGVPPQVCAKDLIAEIDNINAQIDRIMSQVERAIAKLGTSG